MVQQISIRNKSINIMTILYNTTTTKTQPVYTVNGKPVSVERLAAQGLVELTVVNTDKPPITNEQYLVESWQPDLINAEYKQHWMVKDYTAYELDVREWGDMAFAHKVIAPVALNDTYPSIVTWAILNPSLMELDTRGELVHVLYNSLRDEHAALINQLGLEILNRPTK